MTVSSADQYRVLQCFLELVTQYRIARLCVRPWISKGISARLIASHHERNYDAAPNRLNAITEELKRLDLKTISAPAILIASIARCLPSNVGALPSHL